MVLSESTEIQKFPPDEEQQTEVEDLLPQRKKWQKTPFRTLRTTIYNLLSAF
jgi:hypothetical protein